ncbi:hypothetical protein D1632_10735 [Chryseobacterium nematophagum]|uniref:Terminase large subunit gp17-like C-terminal domain-containing protein n=1 Tax=Chryseobacterium nematophagum TaxID=2305228 RepID=A0A3M7LEX1_9FLAO|nr:phage terminase large subunit [Chryseobacterium nematophagum]RMZ60056.1 hypothetical protein D1632_10735 [Chryseobacterium nematophagum]
MEQEIELLEHQAAFIESDFIHTAIVGGYRSGKSHAGAIKTILKKLAYPGIDVAYYLPTYGLIKDIAYSKFSHFLSRFKIKYTLNRSDYEYLTPYGKIILRSMDNPDTIIGYEVGYSLIDEADILSTSHMEDILIRVVARLSVPLPDEKPNSLDFVSTPEGFKFLYNFFVKNKHQDKKLIQAKTKNNPFISKSYISTLEMSYTAEQLEAYLNGEFVNLTIGSVYKKYDRVKNKTVRVIQPGDVLHIGMDFNITKMNAVIHVQDSDFKYAVDEVVNAYDTDEVCAILKRKYTGHKIIIYPDAAGKARSTSGKSDHEIIRSYGYTIRVGNTNPLVKDRVNNMNIAFCDKEGNRSYLINDEQCPTYSEALERQTYKNGEPDKSTGFDHITEAGGYFIWNSSISITYKIS